MTDAADRLRDFLTGLVEEGVVPGGVAWVGRASEETPCFHEAFGRASVEPTDEPATRDTVYDCASLTKPLVTASLCLVLRERGELDFDAPASRWLPELVGETGVRVPTVAELLTHSAGLPAWEPLYVRPGGGDLAAWARWLGEHRNEPGRRAVYGCPAFLLLGLLLERLTGHALSELATSELLSKRDDVFFTLPDDLVGRAAPTERGSEVERTMAAKQAPREAAGHDGFRDALIRGRTHDGNAHALGGAAGNAGLFGTADGIAALGRRFLGPGELLPAPALAELSVDQVAAAARGDDSEQRSWGFQLARSLNSPAGPALSERAFGHAGFTGTSLLLDPECDGVFVLLTNRIHPEFRERAFHADRRRFHELARPLIEATR
ncbi:MAG: serine hydrolase domain-containing protein [Acidobacteriota bacterium]